MLNYKLFKRNIAGLFVIMSPVFFILLVRSHSMEYALLYGLASGLAFAFTMSSLMLFFDRVDNIEIKGQENVDRLIGKYEYLKGIKEGLVYLVKSDTLFGDVEFKYQKGSLFIKGSSYRLRKYK